MNCKDNAMAILRYENFDSIPVVSFGYWRETLDKWYKQGHITKIECNGYRKDGDNSPADKSIMAKLGFDFNWNSCFSPRTNIYPKFKEKVIEDLDDGMQKRINGDGVIVLQKKGVVSIPAEVGHLLVDRKTWEEHFVHRLQYSEKRLNLNSLNEYKDGKNSDIPLGLHCGSLIGNIRNWLGVTGLSYLYADDEELFDEIIQTVGELCYQVTKRILSENIKFDYAHFWEDICFKNGPLVTPSVFDEKVGPYYKKITSLLNEHNIEIVSLDCDGMIDSLIPTWFNNGVNTMFPIEVGTWNASIAPWREKYGKDLRGVGGMNKTVFAAEKSDIDKEIERLKPLISLGGYIPCPDHRIAPDAKWENVQYYCEQIRKIH